jgi:hypothetical protein
MMRCLVSLSGGGKCVGPPADRTMMALERSTVRRPGPMPTREESLSVLELHDGATRREINDAYRQLVQVWHPDPFAHSPKLQLKATERLKRLNDVYNHLTKPAIDHQPPTTQKKPAEHASDVEKWFNVQCPNCSRRGRAKMGQPTATVRVKCPNCGEVFAYSDTAGEDERCVNRAPIMFDPEARGAMDSVRRWIMLIGIAAFLSVGGWVVSQTPWTTSWETRSQPLDIVALKSRQRSGAVAKKAGAAPPGRHQAPATPGCEPGRPASRPQSGGELGPQFRDGLGLLTIINSTDLDALAVLRDAASDDPRRAIYIRAGESGPIKGIHRGSYRLSFQFGNRWLQEGRFCELYGTTRIGEAFQFKEGAVESDRAYSAFEVTLRDVPSSNAETQRLPDRPLPLPAR